MSPGEPTCGGLCNMLWNDCKEEALLSLYSPFVTSLGRGDLPRYYVVLHRLFQLVHYV